MTIRRVFTGKNVQEATAVALETLGAELEDVDIRVLNPGRSGIFGLGGALAEIEVAKLSDVIAEEAMEAAERQAQMDEATGVTASAPTPQPRQSRNRQRRERPARGQEEPSKREAGSEDAESRRERPTPRRNRQPAQNRQRRQRRSNNQRSRQERTQPEPAAQESRDEQPAPRRQEPVAEPIQNREELEATTGEILGYLIAAMNVDVEAYVLDDLRDGSIVFEIEGADAGLLIGRRGETLRDLQFIVRMLVNRQLKQRANIIIDVERYQLRRTQKLHTIAESAARAASPGRARSLD
ncbi:MAG: KH domain-containing protein, partial [Chloroflexi bacterium]|nr:KH domain-containing protein [Chloroflexota bacterium]